MCGRCTFTSMPLCQKTYTEKVDLGELLLQHDRSERSDNGIHYNAKLRVFYVAATIRARFNITMLDDALGRHHNVKFNVHTMNSKRRSENCYIVEDYEWTSLTLSHTHFLPRQSLLPHIYYTLKLPNHLLFGLPLLLHCTSVPIASFLI